MRPARELLKSGRVSEAAAWQGRPEEPPLRPANQKRARRRESKSDRNLLRRYWEWGFAPANPSFGGRSRVGLGYLNPASAHRWHQSRRSPRAFEAAPLFSKGQRELGWAGLEPATNPESVRGCSTGVFAKTSKRVVDFSYA
jgi:hypothetical protein